MSLTVVLETPGLGMISPPVIGGYLEFVLDRYPRWYLTADLTPDPQAIHLWQSPYGTRVHVLDPSGAMVFSGPMYQSQITRPDGRWNIQAADDTLLLRRYQATNRPGQFLAGTTMTVRAFIDALAQLAQVPIVTAGDLGLVDVRELDLAGSNAWSMVEEQLVANDLDVWPQGDGTLLIAPTAAIKATPDRFYTVGTGGTLTAYMVTMTRVYNRVIITHEANKTGETETRYIDGTWTDSTSSSGTQIGINAYTQTVRVGADWWDDPAGHQAQADANAAAVAESVRGLARSATIDTPPDYAVRVGETAGVTFLVNVTDTFLVTGATWPLGLGPMQLQLRNPRPDWPAGAQFFAEEVRHARQHT